MEHLLGSLQRIKGYGLCASAGAYSPVGEGVKSAREERQVKYGLPASLCSVANAMNVSEERCFIQ